MQNRHDGMPWSKSLYLKMKIKVAQTGEKSVCPLGRYIVFMGRRCGRPCADKWPRYAEIGVAAP
jgi:hypothetical protein